MKVIFLHVGWHIAVGDWGTFSHQHPWQNKNNDGKYLSRIEGKWIKKGIYLTEWLNYVILVAVSTAQTASVFQIIRLRNTCITCTRLHWPFQAWIYHCHIHPLQAANCCRNSRLVVDEDDLMWFQGNIHSKTLGCRKIKSVFRDVK